jgi:hypothetical protein
LVCGLAGHGTVWWLTANFLCYHSAKLVTKVVLGKAPKPVYNLASEKVKIRVTPWEVPALFFPEK